MILITHQKIKILDITFSSYISMSKPKTKIDKSSLSQQGVDNDSTSNEARFWKSPLCSGMLVLGLIILTLAALSLWSMTPITPTKLIGVLSLVTLSLFTIVILYKRIQEHLLLPLSQLKSWAIDINEGNLATRLPNHLPGDFNTLAANINELGDQIESLSLDMESQVKKQTSHIERKTHSLEIVYDVAASINNSRNLDDLLTRFLHSLMDVVKARAAVVRLMTDDNQMRLVASLGFDEDLMKREQLIPSDQCLCGNAYKEGVVLFQKNISQCDKIIGRQFFNVDNVHMIAVPLQYRDKTLGVYNLFVDSEDFADPEDIEGLLTSIGRHLGMAIDKARTDEESNRFSIMEERNRLAHELHDSLAQTLASLRFQVRVLDEKIRLGEEPSIWHELEKIENNLDEANVELRELITHFRAPIDERGLVPAVEHLIERFKYKNDMAIFLQEEWNVLSLSPNIEVQALRIIQESLNNISKHSQAHAVRLIMRSSIQGECSILIEDDGVGMDIPPESDRVSGDHLGLSIMDERAKRIGGTFTIESEVGEGTRTTLTFKHQNIIDESSKKEKVLVPPPTLSKDIKV